MWVNPTGEHESIKMKLVDFLVALVELNRRESTLRAVRKLSKRTMSS